MGIATNVLGILKLATGAARIGRGGSTVDADLTTLESGQTTLNDTLTAEAGKVATLQRQVVPLARAVRVAMSAANQGIKLDEAVEFAPGASDHAYTIRFYCDEIATGELDQPIFQTRLGVSTNDIGGITIKSDGTVRLFYKVGSDYIIDVVTSSAIPAADNSAITLGVDVIRETVTDAGSVVFSLNGNVFETIALTAGARESVNLSGFWFLFGHYGGGVDIQGIDFTVYNRALSSAERVLEAINGPSPADLGTPGNRASQVPTYQSDFSVDADGWLPESGVTLTPNQDTIDGENDWLKAQRTGGNDALRFSISGVFTKGVWGNVEGVKVHNPTAATRWVGVYITQTPSTVSRPEADVFVEIPAGETRTIEDITAMSGIDSGVLYISSVSDAGTVATVGTGTALYFKGISTKRVGVTGRWSAEHAQSDTGQVIEQMHGSHGLLPSTGATIHPQPEGLRQVRSTLTWNGDSSAKYLVSNQDILPEGAEIERVTVVIEGTPVDGTLGDSADNDRYCTLGQNTGLIEGSNRLAIAERTTDGTNRELLWTPSAAFTGTIKFTIHYFVGEQ